MEDMNNKVSIITICYNCKADLEKTMASVVAQTYTEKEYIVVDGGSTDGTADLLEQQRDNIDVCISEPDDGIYDALNKGVSRATGEWIICMNAGDVFYDDDVLSRVFANPIPQDKTFIYSDFELDHGNGKHEHRTCNRLTGDIHHQNAIYRRSLHQRYGYYIVTHPYIVSDLLFFLAIPAEQYLKTDHVIALVKADGISCQLWASQQAWAAKVVYGMETIPHIFYRDMRMRFGLWRRKILGMK
jgi:glycosyltransferase involved in cell wall biosynthesis